MIQLETAIDNSDRAIFESVLKEHNVKIVAESKCAKDAMWLTLELADAGDIFWLGRLFQSRLENEYEIKL